MKPKTLLLYIFVLLFLPVNSTVAENYPYRSDVLWVAVPSHSSWLYETNEQASVEVEFYHYGVPQNAVVDYEIAPDLMPAIKKGKVRLKNGRAVIKLGTMNTPGFLDCRMKTMCGGYEYKHHVKVGFSPDKLMPYTKDPSDFDSFWNQTLSEVRLQPLSYTCEKVAEYSSNTVDCYLIKLQVDKEGHSVYGYLTKPKKQGKYPVVLCPPGAGIKTIKEPLRHIYYAQNGFVRLEIEIHGLDPRMSNEKFNELSKAFNNHENGYLQYCLDSRDDYYMRHVYAACVRAIDLLTALPEWDCKNVIVQGGSQGGALTLVTAGLDKRVTLAVVNHPALSDMAGSLVNRADGYPHFSRMNGMLTQDKLNTMQYYDVCNFARRISCPVYMTWGYNDDVCPPTTSYIVWNLLKGVKDSLITPINEHWTSDQTEYGQMLYIQKHLKK